MFTGLIQAVGTVADLKQAPPGRRLTIEAPQIAAASHVGDSIAIAGCCLTVVDVTGGLLAFEAGPETLARTRLGRLIVGDKVNLEPSLRVGEAMGGHFVTGHIDAVGIVRRRSDDAAWSTVWIEVRSAHSALLAPQGSVAVDGVSLTVVETERDAFSVALIPHTLAVTTLERLATGDAVNLEFDLLAKYVRRLLAHETESAAPPTARNL